MGITKQDQIEEAYRDAEAEEKVHESIAQEDEVGFKEPKDVVENKEEK